jgi:hypothetical protein
LILRTSTSLCVRASSDNVLACRPSPPCSSPQGHEGNTLDISLLDNREILLNAKDESEDVNANITFWVAEGN